MLKPKQREAVALVADGKLENDDIARQVGISPRTLDRWKSAAEFKVEVDLIKNAWRASVTTEGIADQHRRVFRLNDHWRRLQNVIEQRAQDPDMRTTPGGDTGLMMRTLKSIGSGESMRVVKEYRVDTGLLAEIRAHEEQAAIELGQWKKEEIRSKQMIIVVPQGSAPSTPRVLELPEEEPPLQISGVVIDLVPAK